MSHKRNLDRQALVVLRARDSTLYDFAREMRSINCYSRNPTVVHFVFLSHSRSDSGRLDSTFVTVSLATLDTWDRRVSSLSKQILTLGHSEPLLQRGGVTQDLQRRISRKWSFTCRGLSPENSCGRSDLLYAVDPLLNEEDTAVFKFSHKVRGG